MIVPDQAFRALALRLIPPASPEMQAGAKKRHQRSVGDAHADIPVFDA